LKEKKTLIRNLERLLSKPELLRLAAKEELLKIRDTYSDVRRTQIVADASGGVDISAADLLPDELAWVLLSQEGTLARTPGPQMITFPAKPSEQPASLLEANTQDILYLFTADGQAVSLPVYQLPQARSLGEGVHWADLTGLTRRQHMAAALVRPSEATGFLALATIGGVIKRIRLEDLPGITGAPFTVINVADDDSLGWACLTDGKDELMLATAAGQVIRFREDEVRPMGLPAAGVMAIKLSDEADGVVSMDIVQPDALLWSITDNGLAKTTPMSAYPTQGRYGQGVINVRLPKEASEVVAVAIGSPKATIFVNTAGGSSKRMPLGKAVDGNRPIKPRPVVRLGQRNRVTGAVMPRPRHSYPAGGSEESA
jgi:DNA gyrase subunit A